MNTRQQGESIGQGVPAPALNVNAGLEGLLLGTRIQVREGREAPRCPLEVAHGDSPARGSCTVLRHQVPTQPHAQSAALSPTLSWGYEQWRQVGDRQEVSSGQIGLSEACRAGML